MTKRILCALLGLNARRQEKQPVVEILQTGCGMLGLAGLRAEKKHGRCGVLATDLCALLGNAWAYSVERETTFTSRGTPPNRRESAPAPAGAALLSQRILRDDGAAFCLRNE